MSIIDPTWHMVESNMGACLVRKGGNPRKVQDRVAFIEKTPRIRIRDDNRNHLEDHLHWAQRPFKGEGPEDQRSRAWCEQALVLFGHEFASSQ